MRQCIGKIEVFRDLTTGKITVEGFSGFVALHCVLKYCCYCLKNVSFPYTVKEYIKENRENEKKA